MVCKIFQGILKRLDTTKSEVLLDLLIQFGKYQLNHMTVMIKIFGLFGQIKFGFGNFRHKDLGQKR